MNYKQSVQTGHADRLLNADSSVLKAEHALHKTCYIGTLNSQANIMVRMLKIPYVKRQLADDSENKISFVAYFWTICPFKNT